MKSLALLLAFVAFSQAHLIQKRQVNGPCPVVTPAAALDAEAYLGRWYQPSGSDWNGGHPGDRCIAADYTDLGDGTFSVFNQEITASNEWSGGCGRACIPDPENRPAEILVTFVPTDDTWCQYDDVTTARTNYQILAVDENVFSAVHYCEEAIGTSTQVEWVLTREPNPPQEVIDMALAAYEANGIDTSGFIYFQGGDAAGCTYDPPEDEVIPC